MTGTELQYVRDTIDNEGFDYAFRHYTDFVDEVKDVEFHKLRKAYVEAAKELDVYV
jgi:ribosomal protein L19